MMRRREFLGITLGGAGWAVALRYGLAGNGEEADIRRAIVNWTEAFTDRSIDQASYSALMTNDYQGLEAGRTVDLADELRCRAFLPSDHRRVNQYRFNRIHVDGPIAWADLTLVSSISDSPGGDRIRQWSGRVELLQSGGNWLASRLRASPVNVRTAVNWRTAKGLV